jgi:hypothetical protein
MPVTLPIVPAGIAVSYRPMAKVARRWLDGM